MQRLRARPAIAAIMALLLGGCASVGLDPEDYPSAAEPRTAPVTRVTSFTGALACMDDLFLRAGTPKRYITAISLPDQTGQSIGGGALNMLISAVSEMNRRSNAFQFVYLPVTFTGNIPNPESGRIDLSYLLGHIQVALGGNASAIDLPDYLLVASITELDRGVAGARAGGGWDFGKLAIGVSADKVISVMTTDFNIADGRSFKIISGATATNTVALVSRSAGADLDARLKSSGGFLTLAVDRADGEQAAMRALIQLSAIESLGKLAGVPYQQCLQQRRTATGAVSRTGVAPLRLSSPRTSYGIGDKLVVSALTSRDADLFCYYQNAKGRLWQVLPTDYQPDNRAAPGSPLVIPGTPRVDLVFDAQGSEWVMCLATPLGSTSGLISALPRQVSRTDMQPLAVSSLDAIEDAFRAALRLPEDLSRADLRVEVK